jgi:hypothetical protein
MVITVEKFAEAIRRRLEVSPEQAFEMAHRVLNYFGFESFIIDNAIDQEDRKLFYQLHDTGLLRSSWETVLLLNGRSWRIFYWEISADDLDRVLETEQEEAAPLYDSLPDEYWGRPAQQT